MVWHLSTSELLLPYNQTRSLMSSGLGLLSVPRSRLSTMGWQVFGSNYSQNLELTSPVSSQHHIHLRIKNVSVFSMLFVLTCCYVFSRGHVSFSVFDCLMLFTFCVCPCLCAVLPLKSVPELGKGAIKISHNNKCCRLLLVKPRSTHNLPSLSREFISSRTSTSDMAASR